MKKASISHTRNNLSRLLEEVRQGETIVITDRRRPVAKLEPYIGGASGEPGVIDTLVSQGLVSPPKRPLDLQAFLASERPRLSGDAGAARAVSAERNEGM